MPRLTQELQFPNQSTNPKAPYNGVAVFCKNGSLYTIDTNGIVALIRSGSDEPVDLSNYYTISETDNAISTAINALINGAPGTLDTLKELADAVNSNKSLVDALNEAITNKQDTLVSGTNIKTINGNSILGEGNLVIEGGDVDLSNYYTKTETDTKLDTKQNNLVSGTNIKTINSQSILGEGNIEVTIPDATTATSGAMSAADKTKLDSISNEWTGTQSEYDALTTKDNNTIYYVTE